MACLVQSRFKLIAVLITGRCEAGFIFNRLIENRKDCIMLVTSVKEVAIELLLPVSDILLVGT